MKKALLARFLNYISIDTQSDPASTTYPSTKNQFELARLLVDELKNLGLKDAHVDHHCYVMATLPSTIPDTGKKVPVIGFLAHMDTAPDMKGNDIKPTIIENYPGDDILINQEKQLYLKPSEFPELKKYIGQTLITTDGTTLLGADDKAGIAEIITAMEYLITHPEIKHGTIKIAFTPDEEIGKGVDHFDIKKFGADYAYTLDGGELGEIEYENFNAAYAKVIIQGRNIHPGMSKQKMLNSIILGNEFNSLLPVFDRPEFTENFEGFNHIIRNEGTVDRSVLQYIIRDHDREKFERRKDLFNSIAEFMNRKYSEKAITIEMTDQYYNMREKIEPVYHIVEKAKQALLDTGLNPKIKPIRGGTDGSRLSFMGLPCPNIFAGGHNFHGRYEFIPLESMEKATRVIIRLAQLYASNQ